MNIRFFFNDPATNEIYTYVHTLSLHDALPISLAAQQRVIFGAQRGVAGGADDVRLVPRHAALTPACACRGRSAAAPAPAPCRRRAACHRDRKSTRLNSSH